MYRHKGSHDHTSSKVYRIKSWLHLCSNLDKDLTGKIQVSTTTSFLKEYTTVYIPKSLTGVTEASAVQDRIG